MPCSMDLRAALSAAICAANGVDFLLPLNPMPPALAQAMAPPVVSLIETIVLLKLEWMCAMPCETCLASRFFRVRGFLATGITLSYPLLCRCVPASLADARAFGFLAPGDGLFRTLA